MSIEAALLKQVMRRFATGVMVLTVPAGKGMHAVTVNAVTSLSLNPTLMLVCIEKNAQSHALIRQTRVFVLNILSEAQAELGQRFAFDREARTRPLDHVHGRVGQTGGLIVDGALGFLECRLTAEYPGGDHTIFIGEVVHLGLSETTDGPLLYYGGRFARMQDPEE